MCKKCWAFIGYSLEQNSYPHRDQELADDTFKRHRWRRILLQK